MQRICRHDPLYPAALRGAHDAPRMLHVAGGFERMRALLAQPTVAIVGTRRASDYGMEVAYGLARGLAASGITVVSGLAEGIAAAAHQGALQAGARTVTVMAGGVDVANPASWRGLHRRIAAEGCALAELPCGAVARGWCHIARARIVAALARIVIVVEAHEHPAELLHARLAAAAGTTVAAVPGRVSAPAARGPHQLLREGALLVRDPQDVLDALYGVGTHRAAVSRPAQGGRLQAVLDQVGSGNDTVAKLTAADALEGAPAQRGARGAGGARAGRGGRARGRRAVCGVHVRWLDVQAIALHIVPPTVPNCSSPSPLLSNLLLCPLDPSALPDRPDDGWCIRDCSHTPVRPCGMLPPSDGALT